MVLEEDYVAFSEATNDGRADLPPLIGRGRSTSKRDIFNIKATLVTPPIV